jgi:hypothetical protein
MLNVGSRVYANGWHGGAKTPEQLAEKARQTVEQCFSDEVRSGPRTLADLHQQGCRGTDHRERPCRHRRLSPC